MFLMPGKSNLHRVISHDVIKSGTGVDKMPLDTAIMTPPLTTF